LPSKQGTLGDNMTKLITICQALVIEGENIP